MKYILTLLLGYMAISASAQLSFEHAYTKVYGVQVVNIEGEGQKYWAVDTSSKRVMLFNDDHSLWKKTNVTIPNGYSFISVSCISKNLINTDNKIEFAYTYATYSPAIHYVTDIYNEDGTVLQSLNDVTNCRPVEINGKWKIIGSKGYEVNIYSVPGTYVGVQKKQPQEGADAELFPNPMNSAATLRYSLPQGVYQAQLNVFNAAGIQVRSYTVTDKFNDVLIDRNDLPAGVYTYQLSAPGISPVAEKFIIQ